MVSLSLLYIPEALHVLPCLSTSCNPKYEHCIMSQRHHMLRYLHHMLLWPAMSQLYVKCPKIAPNMSLRQHVSWHVLLCLSMSQSPVCPEGIACPAMPQDFLHSSVCPNMSQRHCMSWYVPESMYVPKCPRAQNSLVHPTMP